MSNVTDYDNMTDDYNNTLLLNNNFTGNENNIDIFTPKLLFTTPCGLSFLCLMSLMVYTLFKRLINNEKICTIIIVSIKYTSINDN